MRKAVLAIAGAAALTIGSAASATVTVSAPTGVLAAGGGFVNVSNGVPAGNATIAFGNNTVPGSSSGGNPVSVPFTGGFNFTNTLNGLYNITLSVSTSGMTLNNYPTIAGYNLVQSGSSQLWSLFGVYLAANTYGVAFSGQNDSGNTGTFNGNITITPALPEPATWAMMLLGFGAIGLTLRSRRKPALAQVA